MADAYIAGPVTGMPDYNSEAFNEAAAYFRKIGYNIINPLENFGGDRDRPYEDYIQLGVEQAQSVRWVFVLPGWETSPGARREVQAALNRGVTVFPYFRERARGNRCGWDKILTVPGMAPVVSEAPSVFESYLNKMQEIHRAKRADYTGGGDILHNYRTSAKLAGITVGTGMFARMCEKIVRLSVCLPKDGTEVKDETVEDTLLDVAIIAILMLVERESRKVGEEVGFI